MVIRPWVIPIYSQVRNAEPNNSNSDPNPNPNRNWSPPLGNAEAATNPNGHMTIYGYTT